MCLHCNGILNAPFHVRMMYLSISSKKPDSLGKTVVKIIFKFTNARAQGFSPRNVCLMAHYLLSDSYGCYFTSFLSNIIPVKILEKQKLFLYISFMLKNRF